MVALAALAGCGKDDLKPSQNCSEIIKIETIYDKDGGINSYNLVLKNGTKIITTRSPRYIVGSQYCQPQKYHQSQLYGQ